MKYHKILLLTLSALLCIACQEKNEVFDNMVYSTTDALTKSILKPSVKGFTCKTNASVAKPAAEEILLTYVIDSMMVNQYNLAFYDDAVMLPEKCYKLIDSTAVIAKGGISSSDIRIEFKNLNELSYDNRYVLPLSIDKATNIEILESKKSNFFVFEGGALINVVADMKKEAYISFPSFMNSEPSAQVCNNLNDYTLETLIRVREFKPGIQTVMGIEGYFLIRISDNGLEPNQLQISTNFSGNLTDANTCLLKPNKWTHIAVVGESQTNFLKLYIDGELALTSWVSNWTSLSLGTPQKQFSWAPQANPFYIGFSYSAGRELDGEFSECRIWNIARTQDEIKNNFYEVDPQSEGLVAYWKFDEGKGNIINDYSGNGNNGIASSNITWNSVSLPESGQK